MKNVFICLFLCISLSSLHAQYTYNIDSLGIRVDFPCLPTDVTTYSIPSQEKTFFTCQPAPAIIISLMVSSVSMEDIYAGTSVKEILKKNRDAIIRQLKAKDEKLEAGEKEGTLEFNFTNGVPMNNYVKIYVISRERPLICVLWYIIKDTRDITEEWILLRDSFVADTK